MSSITLPGSRYPCTLIFKTAQWMLDRKLTLGVSFSKLTTTRFAELMVHKPGEGVALSLLATLLTPLVR
jgi:dimethylaniline monooxygenase (N-oxide forming)